MKAFIYGLLIGASNASLQDNVDCVTIAGGNDDNEQYEPAETTEECGTEVTKETC